MDMRKKYFFKAPYDRATYISLRIDSEKFVATKDKRYIVATEPLTLREYYVAFRARLPFKAYVKDKVELLVPDDLEKLAELANKACRGIRRILLTWWTDADDDYTAEEEIMIIGNFRWGVAKMLVKGFGVVETPYTCDPADFPEECMWPHTLLTILYELVYEYKMLKYRGADTAELVAKLFSDSKNGHNVTIFNANVDEVENVLKKEGFAVSRLCKKPEADVEIRRSSGKLVIVC